MAIGPITSPATWLLGTVAAPSWFQNVEDNINGWIGGTGPTLKALQIDGVGGAASITSPGNLAVSGGGFFGGGIAAGGNSSVTGTFSSSVATSKQMWMPGMYWLPQSATVNNNFTVTGVGITGTGAVRMGLFLPFSATGNYTLTSAVLYVNKTNTTSTTFQLNTGNPTTVDTTVASVSSTTSGNQTMTLSGLSLVCSATQIPWLEYSTAQVGDALGGVLLTYTSPVF